MAEPQEVVIVDKNGTEHVFPPGFDPQKAAMIVRQSSLRSGAVPEGIVGANEPGTYWGGVRKGLMDIGNQMFESAAHPQTLGDFLGLMVPTTQTGALRAADAVVPRPAQVVSGAREAVAGARAAAHTPADIALDMLVKKTGVDPTTLDLQSTRMRLQAARSRTRQAQMLNDLPLPEAAQADAASQLNAIMEAVTRPESSVKLTDWQSQFLQSVSDQVKGGGRLSARQAQVIRKMYTGLGLTSQ